MSRNPRKSIPLLRFLKTVYLRVTQVCSKVGVTWMWSPIDGNLSSLCLGPTSFLVPEKFKLKVLISDFQLLKMMRV